MTHIVKGYATKKALREGLAAGDNPWLSDPSIIRPHSLYAQDIRSGHRVMVTNHPKRSWFASIERDESGNLRVI